MSSLRKRKRYVFYKIENHRLAIHEVKDRLDDLYRYLYGEVERASTLLKMFRRNNNLVICVDKNKLFRALSLITLLKIGLNLRIKYRFVSSTYKEGLRKLSNLTNM